MVMRKLSSSNQEFRPSERAFGSFKVLRELRKNLHPQLFSTDEEFKRFNRQFNIDLAPKFLFSKSVSVDMFIKSQVASYLEFNNVNQNYFYSP